MNTTQTTKVKRIPTSAFRGTKEVCSLCEGNSSQWFRSIRFGVRVCRVCSKGAYQEHYSDASLQPEAK